jgi:hypothetical protein
LGRFQNDIGRLQEEHEFQRRAPAISSSSPIVGNAPSEIAVPLVHSGKADDTETLGTVQDNLLLLL